MQARRCRSLYTHPESWPYEPTVAHTAAPSYGVRMHPHVNLRIAMGFYFFPRGGSAQVVRYLCRALAGTRWTPTLFAGSVGPLADSSNAHHFFTGIDCLSLDFSPAVEAWRNGADPMAQPDPMPASFEDKEGVPDRIFLDLDAAAFDRQVVQLDPVLLFSRRRCTRRRTPAPSHAYARGGSCVVARCSCRYAPARHRVEDVDRDRTTGRTGTSGSSGCNVGREDPNVWWSSPATTSTWCRTCCRSTRHVSPRFRVVSIPTSSRRACAPMIRGLRSGGAVSSTIRVAGGRVNPKAPFGTTTDDLSAFSDSDGRPVPVLLFAGRFMGFKRLQLLIEAHHVMRSTTNCRAVLVVAGGFPGEWEGEHPYDTVQRLGATGVFFVGWQDHHDLAELLNCSDVFAAPSVDEPFGLVYLEAMASGIPPIGTSTGGPLSFINVDPARPTGWLVAPDDVDATARTLAEAASDHAAREQRGTNAAQFIRDHYSWAESANAFARLYDEVRAETNRSPSSSARSTRRSASRRTGSCSSRRRAGDARSTGRHAPRPTADCVLPTLPVAHE